jgi:hypothetical protein
MPQPTIPPGPNVVPASGIYLGAFVNTGTVTPPPIVQLTNFEAEVGRTMALTQHYYGFYDDFPGVAEAQDAANGRIPIESWDCQPTNAGIAAGNADAAIRTRADALKAYGRPIFVRYMWEMNLPQTPTFRLACHSATTDSPNGVFSPAEYVAAWRHIRTIFMEEGVTNVVWLWNPSGSNDPAPYYPGAAYVDWVGVDKYDDADVSFAATFAQAYGFLTPFGKPIMIAETGADVSIQPAFLNAAAATLQTQYPQVKALVYFDSSGFTDSWTLSPQGLSAFRTMGANPYFAAVAP